MAALQAAVAHADRPGVARTVGDGLHLDVPRRRHEPLHEDGCVAERLLRLGAGALEGVRSSLGPSTRRIPRPPPPAVALTISG